MIDVIREFTVHHAEYLYIDGVYHFIPCEGQLMLVRSTLQVRERFRNSCEVDFASICIASYSFAIRIDVAEDLGRLAAHLDEIDAVLAKGGETGRRLDFIIQELHREANTLGSKSSTLELTRISVDMKVLIEQMREQVQNLE